MPHGLLSVELVVITSSIAPSKRQRTVANRTAGPAPISWHTIANKCSANPAVWLGGPIYFQTHGAARRYGLRLEIVFGGSK